MISLAGSRPGLLVRQERETLIGSVVVMVLGPLKGFDPFSSFFLSGIGSRMVLSSFAYSFDTGIDFVQ